MRIAVFYSLAFGGAKRVVFEHIKGLKKRNHTVDVYIVNPEPDIFDPTPYCDTAYTYIFRHDIYKFPIIGRFMKDYKTFFHLKNFHKKIAKDIDKGKYDVVLVHPDRFTQAPFILKFLKTPSVYYCQEPLRIVYEYALRLKDNVGLLKHVYEDATRMYLKRIDRENVRAATLTIASCYHIRERMIEVYDVYPKVVYCGIDDTIFRPLKQNKSNQIFFVGSTTISIDGYDLIEKAFHLIPENLRPKLRIVSWQNENKNRLTDKALVETYNHSIVTLCLSRFETFGLVPLESMACGTPVIATKVSGHRETVVDNKTGFLVDFDPKEIAKKLMFLIKNPSKVITMGKNARRHIENSFTWKIQIDILDKTLTEVGERTR